MAGPFDMFVVFAEMRTGSNLLEANLNDLPGVTCHGEAFNPVFVGGPNRDDLLGVTLDARTADPMPLLDRIAAAPGLNGFRFFHDHDPRVLARILPDPACAKIVLTRNPLDSYVSRKIAARTGQWKLTNMAHQRAATVRFDADEFAAHLEALQAFQLHILRGLQTTGQTAFWLDYDDLRELDVINGLAAFLGCEARLTALSKKLKKQNPGGMEDKVENLPEMTAALARLDRFNLTRTPAFEPRRGPSVPTYRAGAVAPLLFVPLHGGPEGVVLRWLAALDGVAEDDLPGDFTRKTLRQWKRQRPGHRSFAVLSHPVVRAHRVFCRQIVRGGRPDLRATLVRAFRLDLPDHPQDPGWDADRHRAAFLAWLDIVRGTLTGQTALRPDPGWATQTALLQGVAQVAPPDMLLREDDLGEGLAHLAAEIGRPAPPAPATAPADRPYPLDAIRDAGVDAAVQAAYGRDYETYGFETRSAPARRRS